MKQMQKLSMQQENRFSLVSSIHILLSSYGVPTRYRDNAETTNVINPDLSVKYAIDPDEVNAQEFYKSGITSVGFSPDHCNVIGGQITVCKDSSDHMANRIVKEACSNERKAYAQPLRMCMVASNQMPKTRNGNFPFAQRSNQKR